MHTHRGIRVRGTSRKTVALVGADDKLCTMLRKCTWFLKPGNLSTDNSVVAIVLVWKKAFKHLLQAFFERKLSCTHGKQGLCSFLHACIAL